MCNFGDAKDPMNSSSFKNENQLENELANILVYLRAGLIAYLIQHESFIFPDDKIQKEMISDIHKWSQLITNRPKALESYRTLIKLIEGSIIEIPNNCFHNTNSQPDEKAPNNFNLLYNKYNDDEKNMEAYFEMLYDRIKSNKNITKSEYEHFGNLINKFQISSGKIPLERKIISGKIEKYQKNYY